MTLEITVAVPKDQTPAETVDWLQRYMAFYHPSMLPVVVSKRVEVQEPEDDGEDLL